MANSKTKKISINVTEKMKREIDNVARINNRTVQQEVEYWIAKELHKQKFNMNDWQ